MTLPFDVVPVQRYHNMYLDQGKSVVTIPHVGVHLSLIKLSDKYQPATFIKECNTERFHLYVQCTVRPSSRNFSKGGKMSKYYVKGGGHLSCT